MATVVQTSASRQDLLEIGQHIARETQSLGQAQSFLDRIQEKCLLYATQPLMAAARPDLGDQVHTFTVDTHVVIYQPTYDGIRVLMVVHGSRNIPPILKRRIQAKKQ